MRLLPILAIFSFSLHAVTAQEEVAPAPALNPVERSAQGPWGILEYYEVKLSCPPPYLSYISMPSEVTEWFFPFKTKEACFDAMRRNGFTEAEIAFIEEGSRVIKEEESIRFFPAPEAVESMSPTLRMKLSGLLALSPENRFHYRPAFLNNPNVSRYFQDSNLSRVTLQKIAQVAYPTPSGHGFFISDIPYLMKGTQNTEDERILMNSLRKAPALMVRLILDENTSSTESLADYWSAGFKNKQVLPLLDSIASNPDVSRLDIAHLLPPTARRNLNGFPAQADGANGRYPDWFWTCYNFFRFTPKEVYASSENFGQLINNEFSPASAPYQFGDMLVFISRGRPIHGCIYIADDIVYTKNSADLFSPFVLMRLKDVIAYQDLFGDVTMTQLRKNPPSKIAGDENSGNFPRN